MNRYLIIFLTSIIILSCSNKKEKLVGHTWVITEGNHKKQKIEFIDNSSIIISEKYNDMYNSNSKLFFQKNGKIRLPGINSKDIYANWEIKNNTVEFELDSLKYNYIHRKKDISKISNKDFFGNELGMTKDEAIAKSIEFTNKNPIKTNQFEMQMKIYGNAFKYEIDNGVLILTSKTTKIIARKDKTIENILNEYK